MVNLNFDALLLASHPHRRVLARKKVRGVEGGRRGTAPLQNRGLGPGHGLGLRLGLNLGPGQGQGQEGVHIRDRSRDRGHVL